MAIPTVTFTVTYERSGTKPPIFIAGSFTQPTWQPVKLDHQHLTEEYVFSKTFDIIPGTHQYKFRVGYGDWWVCDDTKDKETDAAGNVNNVMTVQSSGTRDLSQPEEASDLHRCADPATKTTPEDCKSPPLRPDGVDGSDEDLAGFLRKEAALPENTKADFHGADDDIEPDGSQPDMARGQNPKTNNTSNSPVNVLLTVSKQKSSAEAGLAPTTGARAPSAASNASAPTKQRSTRKENGVQGGREKTGLQKASLSTITAKGGQQDQEDFSPIKICRIAIQGFFDSLSTLLCGKRRKIFALALTALVIPIVAWIWRS